jgi:hypothetical protein
MKLLHIHDPPGRTGRILDERISSYIASYKKKLIGVWGKRGEASGCDEFGLGKIPMV